MFLHAMTQKRRVKQVFRPCGCINQRIRVGYNQYPGHIKTRKIRDDDDAGVTINGGQIGETQLL